MMTALGENETSLIVGASVIGLIAYLRIVSYRHLVAKVEVALVVGFAFIVFPKGTFFSYVSVLLSITRYFFISSLISYGSRCQSKET